MYEEDFARRLAQLRVKKGVSARDMSLSIGQNPGYINTIENGKAFPTMVNFFYICEFLGDRKLNLPVFFDFGTSDPSTLRKLSEQIKLLPPEQATSLLTIVEGLTKVQF